MRRFASQIQAACAASIRGDRNRSEKHGAARAVSSREGVPRPVICYERRSLRKGKFCGRELFASGPATARGR